MSLFVSSLNSGSNGNCYYVGNQEDAILIDGGISCRQVEKRMQRLGLSLKKVRAIFVSHEHGDHIHGIPALSRKHQIPVYITLPTYMDCRLDIDKHLIKYLKGYEPITVGALTITGFPKLHDACDPHSFIIATPQVTVGVFTDIGAPCEHVINHFKQCHAAFLESNYDEEMLITGRYPIYLKQRVQSNVGHLSNTQAVALFVKHRPNFMSHLFLSHLSAQNNKPEIVEALFNKVADRTEIIVAPRDRETRVYHIRNKQGVTAPAAVVDGPSQLTLFS